MSIENKSESGPKIVFTGGPGAGKTTMVELVTRAYPHSLTGVPEAASLLFQGGFPRFPALEAKRSVQRAIFALQIELEGSFSAQFPGKALVLDRATIDGAAYWPEGADDFFSCQGTSLDEQLRRYSLVVYLESAGSEAYGNNKWKNPFRLETWEEARELDKKTVSLWRRHPSFFFVPNSRSFDHKVAEVLSLVASHLADDAKL